MADTKNAGTRIVAGEQLKDVFGVTPTQLQAIAAVGYNLLQSGKLKESETVFRGLIATDDKEFYGYAGLGAVALSKKPPDLTGAHENLTKAATLNPNDATVQANLGEALLRQAKFEEAAQVLKKAIELDPQQKDPGANRARALVSGLTTVITEVKRMHTAA
jgi:Flp pilus assembly protein TadD